MNMQDREWPSLRTCHIWREAWKVLLEVDGRCHRFRLKRGWAYIMELVGHEGLPARAGQLEAGFAPVGANGQDNISAEEMHGAELRPNDAYARQTVCDWQTIAEIKWRLIHLLDELALAEEYHNYARADELRDEQAQLLKYLQEASGLRGGLRCFASEPSRQRARVAQAINRCLDELAECEPELAKYLRLCLSLGEWFVYHPRSLEIVIGKDWACFCR